MQKEREIMILFNSLLPPGSVTGVDNQVLVRASMPVTMTREVFNWTHTQPRQDQDQELSELKTLPDKWLAALRRLIEGKDPFERASA
jgi:hypothetical protein